MQRANIMVVGGYGIVGRAVCLRLSRSGNGRVIAAGRSPAKAKLFSDSTNGRVEAMELDVKQISEQSPDRLSGVKAVVMCVDQVDTSFVEKCLGMGIHYVDVTGGFDFYRKVKELHGLAGQSGATAVLGAGLAPGMTNLLADACLKLIEDPDSAEISLLLGAGDVHGIAAVRWTVQSLYRTARQAPKKVNFGPPWNARMALPFDLCDQHAIRETRMIDHVQTRFALDSSLMTGVLRILRHCSPGSRIGRLLTGDRVLRGMGKLKIGTDAFAVRVDAYGRSDGKECRSAAAFGGRAEGSVTGRVAAGVAGTLVSGSKPAGVFHIHEIYTLAETIKLLSDPDLTIQWPKMQSLIAVR